MSGSATSAAQQAGAGGAAGVLGALVLVVIIVAIAYWSLYIMAGWREEPRARRASKAGGWEAGAGLYHYEGPRLLLRQAFLRARSTLEAASGGSLRPYTLREIVGMLDLPGGEGLASEYGRAMYSARPPSPVEARRVAERLLEVVRSWRGRGSSRS